MRGWTTLPRIEDSSGVLSVCHIASGDQWAGAEVQIATLLRALRANTEFDISAVLLNQGRLAKELQDAGIAVQIIAEREHGFVSTLRLAVEFLRERNVRIVHSHRYKENLLAALLAQRCGIPVQVRTAHGRPEPFRGWKGLRHGMIDAVDRWSGRLMANAVVAVSDGMAPSLAATYGEQKIVTIRNGIETSRVYSRYARADARTQLRLADAPVVGLVGRLVPIKRLDLFVRMAEKVSRQMTSVQFVIVGDGPERTTWIEQVRTAGLSQKVRFLGHREDVYDVLRALDVLVMCSDHEGMPMALLEAQWLGVPVVGRRVPGVSEILRNEWNGLCVEGDDPQVLASACLLLLCDAELGQALCQRAAQEIERHYSAASNAVLMAQLYGRLAGTVKQ